MFGFHLPQPDLLLAVIRICLKWTSLKVLLLRVAGGRHVQQPGAGQEPKCRRQTLG